MKILELVFCQYGTGTKTYRSIWIDSPEINPHTYSQSMTKEVTIHNGKKIVSSRSGAGKTGQLHEKE